MLTPWGGLKLPKSLFVDAAGPVPTVLTPWGGLKLAMLGGAVKWLESPRC